MRFHEVKFAYRKAAEKNTATDGGVKYAIAALDNGNVYVKASRNVITGTTKAEQRRNITVFFNALLEGNNSLDIPTIEGDVLTITKAETAFKARDDYKTVNDRSVPMSDAEFSVKLRVEAHIDEIAEVSKGPNNSKKGDGKNHPFAKDGFTYRRAYFEDFDGQYYEITISVGHNGTVATVYNVGKINKSALPSAKIMAVVGSKPLGKTLSNDSIRNPDKNVKQNDSAKSGSVKNSVRRKVQPTVESMLRKENAELRNDVARLKELLQLQKTVTKGTVFTQTSVRDAANTLKKKNNASGNSQERRYIRGKLKLSGLPPPRDPLSFRKKGCRILMRRITGKKTHRPIPQTIIPANKRRTCTMERDTSPNFFQNDFFIFATS